MLLESLDLRLTIVDDGEEALAALRTDHYDLVLMDVHMPRMDGREAVRRIRAGEAGRADIPIIALTADAMTGDREALQHIGFDEHVAKPIRPGELLAAIARMAPTQNAEDEAAAAKLERIHQ